MPSSEPNLKQPKSSRTKASRLHLLSSSPPEVPVRSRRRRSPDLNVVHAEFGADLEAAEVVANKGIAPTFALVQPAGSAGAVTPSKFSRSERCTCGVRSRP